MRRIDLENLRSTQKSVIPKKDKKKYSDLIYATTFDGQPGYLYISLEQRTKEEKYIHTSEAMRI